MERRCKSEELRKKDKAGSWEKRKIERCRKEKKVREQSYTVRGQEVKYIYK